jgi:hypothetical protein
MSYNGSGTFNINSAGQPVVAGTVISATAFNALTADLGVGLSTAITKDGQTTTTARITFAQGVTSSLTTDSSSTSTGSIITAGGVGIAKALFVGTTANITGSVTLSSLTSGRVTYASTSGLLVDSANLTFNGTTLTAAGLAGPLNGTVGATTPAAGTFTTLTTSSTITDNGGTANGVTYLNGSKVVTSGSALTFDGTNLGIGTSSPTKKLDVYSTTQRGQIAMSGSNVVAIRWNTTDPNAGERNWEIANNIDAQGALSFRVGASQTADPTTTRMAIDSSGNLGLGVTPSAWNTGYKAFVVGGTNSNNQVGGIASGSGITIVSTNYYRSTTPSDLYAGTGYAMQYKQISGEHQWYTAPSGTAGNAITFTQAMTLDASGNLGIGTSSPDYKFQIEGVGTGVTTRMGITNTTTGSTLEIGSDGNGGFLATTGSYGTLFYTNGSERMRIDSSGYVLIGATSSAGVGDRRLEILSATNNTAGFLLNTTSYNYAGIYSAGDSNIYNYWGTSGSYLFGTADRNTQSFSEKMRIDSSGRLLVGTTAPISAFADKYRVLINPYTNSTIQYGLMVSANANSYTQYAAVFADTYSETIVGSIRFTTSATSYVTSSDYRLKHDIAPMTGALAKVALLKPCTYKWNIDGSNGDGFIAHELAEIVPQCVTGEKDAVDAEGKPQYQGIDTSFLVATLTAAIQEQQALIQSLTTRISALEAK